MSPVVIVKNELVWCDISDRAMCPLFIVLSSPGFNHELRFLQRYKPVFV